MGWQPILAYQREDGWLPYKIAADNRVGFSQIQMVVPIAATAWETAQATRREDFLALAYAACVRWEGWLMANRSTRGTGLCELFCEFDTGHDNSPRVRGLPRWGCAQLCQCAQPPLAGP